MTDFLTFLNTADLDTLTKIPGISRVIAENIIAARPFDFVEDCAKVRGVGKNLLGRMQSFFEAELNESRNSALIPVEEEALPAPIAKSQPAQEPVEDQPSFFSRLGRAFQNFLRTVIRLILIAALIAAFGALFYYGLPYIKETFIVPVEQNAARVSELEDEVTALQIRLAEINVRMDGLETSVQSHTVSIEKMEQIQTTLEEQLKENNDKALLELKHEVMMTRALDMLGRARLYLAQSNFGLAREDVQSARNLLADLQNETNDEVLDLIIQRLDLTLGNLPAFPVVASGDLEIAWQLLVSGEQTITVTPTPFQEPFLTTSPTPNPIVTLTPTIEPQPESSTTPTP